MAVKTFTTGEVLTAADTNTYLANSGLVYITQASWASGGTVSVNNCFTSTYSAYRLIIRNVKHATTDVNVQLRLRASGVDTATNYYWAGRSIVWGGTGGTDIGTGNTWWERVAVAATANAGGGVVDIIDPQKANVTSGIWNGVYTATGGQLNNCSGMQNSTTQFDGFSLIANSGNLTSLTVYVYGYREA